jgi:hypothetical protein
VGKAQGFADRGLIADAFFAKTEAGVVPRFLTGDKNVVNALARMAEMDVNAIGGFRTILKTYGALGFNVVIEGRILVVIPVP